MAVSGVEQLGPRMVRVTLAGRELEGMTGAEPAASVRLLLPPDGSPQVVVPIWNGNEFLLPDGRRPTIRTFTPARLDPAGLELDIEVVIHGRGAASNWASGAVPGGPAAVSGPGRGYSVVPDAPGYLLAGDESAIPAIRQLLGALPSAMPVQVHVEVAGRDGVIALPERAGLTVAWHVLAPGAVPGEILVEAVAAAVIGPGARVWAAGEAAAMQRIRRHLFESRNLPRAQASVRGYWKYGRSGDTDGEA